MNCFVLEWFGYVVCVCCNVFVRVWICLCVFVCIVFVFVCVWLFPKQRERSGRVGVLTCLLKVASWIVRFRRCQSPPCLAQTCLDLLRYLDRQVSPLSVAALTCPDTWIVRFRRCQSPPWLAQTCPPENSNIFFGWRRHPPRKTWKMCPPRKLKKNFGWRRPPKKNTKNMQQWR